MRPRCSILTGVFDFSGCGDCTSCPPFEPAEMSSSEPSAIVLQAIPCIGGLYMFRFEWRKRFAQEVGAASCEQAHFLQEIKVALVALQARKERVAFCESEPAVALDVGTLQ